MDNNKEQSSYGFSWWSKEEAKLAYHEPTTNILEPDRAASINFDDTENLIIEADNLEALKILQKSYYAKVKMIYIDPPYNTGKDFIYSDKFNETLSDYLKHTKQAGDSSSAREKAERRHSKWLSMMYPRLMLARNLLKDDGIMFISIDDNEVHHLRCLMDEIFGEENFVANIIWEKKFAPQNDAKYFSDNHDFILLYAKNKSNWQIKHLPRSEEQNSRYKNLDNDPRGVWMSDNFSVSRNTEKDIYPIITPIGKEVYPPKGRSWRFSKEQFTKLIADNRIHFPNGGNSVPRLKRFLSEVKDGITPLTIWKYQEVGHSQDARKELKAIFTGEAYFDYPKPVSLISRMLQLSTQDDDIIMDFFAGSGTTAQAVMELNKEDGGNRKFILVQLPEEVDINTEAYKAGYHKISDITLERVRRVIANMIADQKEEEAKQNIPKLLEEESNNNFDANRLGFKALKILMQTFL